MKHDRQNVFVILDHFLSCYPPNNPKSQNFEKLKKTPRDIIILHQCTKKYDHMLYYSLDMACNRFNCYFLFWAIFYPFTSLSNSSKNQNLEKLRKTPGDIIILHMCTKNYDQMT